VPSNHFCILGEPLINKKDASTRKGVVGRMGSRVPRPPIQRDKTPNATNSVFFTMLYPLFSLNEGMVEMLLPVLLVQFIPEGRKIYPLQGRESPLSYGGFYRTD
jgi:hypothetical protein